MKNKHKEKEYKKNNSEKIKKQVHDYYLNHKYIITQRSKLWYHNNKEKAKQYKQNNKQKVRMWTRHYMNKFRKSLIQILGNKCSNTNCLIAGGCTDIRCLQLDHINGGGRKELREFKNNIYRYRYYCNHPDEAKQKLQVLCANCNWIKRYENNETNIIL